MMLLNILNCGIFITLFLAWCSIMMYLCSVINNKSAGDTINTTDKKMRTNAEQILRENYKSVEDASMSFAEYVKLESESDPNFFRFFFDEAFENDFDDDLSEEQIEEFETFLKTLFIETGWFYKGFTDKIYKTKEDAEFDAYSDFANDSSSDDYIDEDGELIQDKFDADAKAFVEEDGVVMPMKDAIERGLTTLETLEIR